MPCFTSAPAPVPAEQVVPVPPPTQSNPKSINDYLKLAINDLIKQKASRPRTIKTLKTTIQSRFGKSTPAVMTEQVCALLIKQGYVKLNDEKVSYALPSETA